MYLKQLHLQHFRNHREQQVNFLATKTIWVGNNAQGKSNFLEAIALLSTLQISRTSGDRDIASTRIIYTCDNSITFPTRPLAQNAI